MGQLNSDLDKQKQNDAGGPKPRKGGGGETRPEPGWGPKCGRPTISRFLFPLPPPEAVRVSHDSPKPQTYTFEGPRASKTPPKFHEKTTKRGNTERTLWQEREKNEILGGPAEGGPGEGGPGRGVLGRGEGSGRSCFGAGVQGRGRFGHRLGQSAISQSTKENWPKDTWPK